MEAWTWSLSTPSASTKKIHSIHLCTESKLAAQTHQGEENVDDPERQPLPAPGTPALLHTQDGGHGRDPEHKEVPCQEQSLLSVQGLGLWGLGL